MRPRKILIAACAPRTINVGGRAANRATVRMLSGAEKNPQHVRQHVARFLQHHLRLLRTAGEAGADVAVIPEDCLRLSALIAKRGRTRLCQQAVVEAHERLLDRLGETCRRFHMAIVGGTMTLRRGHYYNTALMLDPSGKVVASYDKTHLPPGEARSTTPGRALPVFDTYLGRIGLLICWDVVFPEPFAVLALKGAEIIFEPTFGHWTESHDVTARSRAMDWCVPLVVSMWGGCACIIDSGGRFAAKTGRVGDSIALAPLELRGRRRWLFFRDVRRQKPVLRRPDLYGAIVNAPRRK